MSSYEALHNLMRIDAAEVASIISQFIADKMHELQREGVVLGVSGGIDSAVVAALCARAVGPQKVTALIMPERESSKRHIADALEFVSAIGVETRVVDLTPILTEVGAYHVFPLGRLSFVGKLQSALVRWAYRYYARRCGETPFAASVLGVKGRDYASFLQTGNAYYRLKHRLRMSFLYYQAELENKLVVGAANKTEYAIGFFVKHGCDHSADVMPLLDLYKTQVRALARHLGIPEAIVRKPPSPDIIPGIDDEEAIGVPYEQLDLILLALEKGWQVPEISAALGIPEKTVRYVDTLVKRSAHMREVYFPRIS